MATGTTVPLAATIDVIVAWASVMLLTLTVAQVALLVKVPDWS